MLDQILVLDRTEKVVAVLSNKLPSACPIIELYQYHEALDGGAYGDTCSLTVPATHIAANNIKNGNYLLFQDDDGFWQEYKITQNQRIDGCTSSLIVASGEHAAYELIGDFIDDIRPTDVTATAAATQALTNTRWELGSVDDLGIASCRVYKTSVLAGLVAISTAWHGELRYRLDVTGGVIAHRYIDILTRRGQNTGKRFELKKDLVEVKQTVDTRSLASALVGRGKGIEIDTDTATSYGRRLEFTDVVWSSPLAKPAGQNWIGDDTVAAAYGPGGRHITDTVTFDDCTDAEELLQLTYNALQVRKNPLVTYELSVIMLEALTGYSHEAVRLGDTVNVINTSVTPAITGQARVIKLERDLMDPLKGTVTLGNYIPTIASAMTDLQLQQASMLDRAGVWDRASAIEKIANGGGNLQYTIDLLKTQLASTTSGMYTDINGNLIFENAEKTAALKLGAGIFALANTKTNGEYNWRTFGTGNGFTADEIIAGGIDAGLIDAGTLSADRIGAKSITADKLAIASPNLLYDIDSFEQYKNTEPLGSKSLLTTCIGSYDTAYHGRTSLKTINSTSNSYKYLNPTANNDYGWIKLAVGKYLLSAYVYTTSASAIRVQLVPMLRQGATNTSLTSGGSVVIGDISTLDVSDGWVRITATITIAHLTQNPYLAFYLRTVTSAASTVYWDALQLEFIGDRTDIIPSPFSAGGATLISGNSITTGKVQSADGEVYFDLDNNEMACSKLKGSGTNKPYLIIGQANDITGLIDSLSLYSAYNSAMYNVLNVSYRGLSTSRGTTFISGGAPYSYIQIRSDATGALSAVKIMASNSDSSQFSLIDVETNFIDITGLLKNNGNPVWSSGNMLSGASTITPVANTPTTLHVSFGVTLPSVPHILVSAGTGSPYTAVRMVSYSNPTTTGFDIVIYRTDTTATAVSWLAFL